MSRPVEKALRAAIVAAVPANTSVTRNRVPEGSTFPVVVFFKSAGTPRYTLRRRNRTHYLYTVKAIAQGDDETAAETLDAAIDAALTDNALEHDVLDDGRTIISSRRESDVAFTEDDDPGSRYQHVGGVYRIVVANP